jgi:DNA-binding transcriptional ArsR family regulator
VAVVRGDADIGGLAAVIADASRARILLALGDGRALPASLLAAEAGVAASTASEHLRKLVEARLVTVHPQGRHRYYRLHGPEVAQLIETLSRLAPRFEVRSLKAGTRAQALRGARTCYDHLAGRLGVAIFASLLDSRALTGGDGAHRVDDDGGDRLSAPGGDLAYRLTRAGRAKLEGLGVELPAPDRDGTTPARYCVDWTEQRHHLSGAVGRALATRLFELGWLRRTEPTRAVDVTADGRRGLDRVFGASVLE